MDEEFSTTIIFPFSKFPELESRNVTLSFAKPSVSTRRKLAYGAGAAAAVGLGSLSVATAYRGYKKYRTNKKLSEEEPIML
jgi:hypothetical protein